MTHRGRLPLRIVELGFLALMGVLGASGVATAAPADELNYIMLQDGNSAIVGNESQLKHVRQLRTGNEPILWFREGGQDYISRDRALIAQVTLTWKPVTDIADQQSKLADQQSKLADQQSKLADQSAELSERTVALVGQETELVGREGGELSEAERREVKRQRALLQDRQRELRRQIKDIERPMHELSGRMNALGRDMTALGQKMNEASARANLESRAVFRRAITSGAAKPAP